MINKDKETAERDPMINFRAPEELRAKFIAACKDHDKQMSQELRGFLRDFIKKHPPTPK